LFFTQQGKDVIHQLAQSTVPTHKQKEKKCKTAKQTKAPFDSQEDLEQSSRISSQPLHQYNLWQLKLTSELLCRSMCVLTRTCCPWFALVWALLWG